MRRKPPACTDTAGYELPRVCHASVQRVLDNPVNVTAQAACDYACVSCPSLGVRIIRDGRTIQKAAFHVDTDDPVSSTSGFEGAEGRDAAITFFLNLMLARKRFPKASKEATLEPKPPEPTKPVLADGFDEF